MAMRKVKPQSNDDRFGIASSKHDKEKSFPRFHIGLEHLPEAKKWEIGKEYLVTLKLKQTGISISKFDNSADFDIIGIDPKGGKGGSDHNSDHA